MSTYLQRAEWAIDHVKNTVRIRTGNRFEGVNRLQGAKAVTNNTVDQSRDFARKQYKTLNLKTPLEEISLRAQVAKHCGCGNCTEQSALAFDWLYDRGERGMAWIGFPDHNHMFTVLGLTAPPSDTEFFTMGSGPPASWSAGAVVCDPWYHEWFVAATDWDRKIGHILRETTGGSIAKGTKCKVQCRGFA